MRSLILLACAVAGLLGGGTLIGLAALGGCLIFCSLCAGGYLVATYDWPEPKAHPAGKRPVALAEYLEQKAAEPW